MHGKGIDREEHCRKLAQEAAGLRYDSPEATAILDREDWSEIWPIVDAEGYLTGGICGSEDGFANVDDLAMVALSDLSDEQLETSDSGYVKL